MPGSLTQTCRNWSIPVAIPTLDGTGTLTGKSRVASKLYDFSVAKVITNFDSVDWLSRIRAEFYMMETTKNSTMYDNYMTQLIDRR